MKRIFMFLFLLVASSGTAFAQDVYVNDYYRSDGTYVQPHYRSQADDNPYNNYSTQGNTNPYTGEQGTRDPYNSGDSYRNSYSNGNSYNNGSSYDNRGYSTGSPGGYFSDGGMPVLGNDGGRRSRSNSPFNQ